MWPDRSPEDDSLWSNWVRSRMGNCWISGSKLENTLAQDWVRKSLAEARFSCANLGTILFLRFAQPIPLLCKIVSYV